MGFFDRLKDRTTPAVSSGPVGMDHEFAVVDVETTGLDPLRDRVIEVGIVLTDGKGRTLGEWCSLVNPGVGVDAGVTYIHGIETEWLAAAPNFGVLAHEIASRVCGRIVVAHNSTFDCNFLDEEFRRAGFASSGDWPAICTLDLADKVGVPRRLPVACAALGIPHETHDALGDARACASLLHRLLPMVNPRIFSGVAGATMGSVPLHGPGVRCVYRQEAKQVTRARPVLEDLVRSLPPYDGSQDIDPHAAGAYLTALEDAIADGYVSEDEVRALGEVAYREGLTGEEVQDLNHELILGLIDTALEDRRMSKAERTEIERVATWLGVDLTDWDAMVKAGRQRVKADIARCREDVAGRTIVFTGAGVHPPNIRDAFAAKYDFTYATRVGAQTDLVVVGTTETQTQQVERARSVGLPIIVESTFWRRLGEL